MSTIGKEVRKVIGGALHYRSFGSSLRFYALAVCTVALAWFLAQALIRYATIVVIVAAAIALLGLAFKSYLRTDGK